MQGMTRATLLTLFKTCLLDVDVGLGKGPDLRNVILAKVCKGSRSLLECRDGLLKGGLSLGLLNPDLLTVNLGRA